MKLKVCPGCGQKSLSEQWCRGRKLRQVCTSGDDCCSWRGEAYTPPKQRITDTKDLRVDNFNGWDYLVYDRYGHVMTISRSYNSESAALKEMQRELAFGEAANSEDGPRTGVVFKTPVKVVLKGKMYRFVNGAMKQVKPSRK